MSYTAITYSGDQLLTVFIDRADSKAQVYYTYDGGEEQGTQYQTADMPSDDQAAARLVNAWIGG